MLGRWDLAGWLYVVWSTAWSVYGLILFFPWTQNDLYWPGFDNVYPLFQSILNTQLALLPNATLDIRDIAAPRYRVYDRLATGVSPVYPRYLVYQELTSPQTAIPSLRRMDPGYLNYMITPYCWVDLNRRWSIAHTSKRLERCRLSDTDNAAVYLEAVLRNTRLDVWLGQNYDSFYNKIAAGVTDLGGASWVAAIVDHQWLSIADELDVWYRRGLVRFELQYGNRVQIGLDDQIQIHTALGTTFAYPIQAIPALNRGPSWTSSYMYMALFNDFNALSSNQSLVLNSALWFGANGNRQLESYDVGLPLNRVFQLVHDAVGALDDIDLRWVRVPDDLRVAVTTFQAHLFEALENADVARAVDDLSTLPLATVPTQWQDPSLCFLGGNPMCSYGAPLPFPQRSFAFDDACGTQAPILDVWTPFNGLFAHMMLGGDASRVCAHVPSATAACVRQLDATARAYRLLLTTTMNRTVLDAAAQAVLPLHLSVMQFVLDANDTLYIDHIDLLHGDFTFFGWLRVYDWATLQREAIRFEGDHDAMTLLSYTYALLPSASNGLLYSASWYLWFVSSTVSLVLCLVALLATMLWLLTRTAHAQWTVFNRIVPAIWLNRSALVVRSITAVLALSTASVQPRTNHGATQLQVDQHDLLVTLVLASEATWFGYACHDLLHPLTTPFTRAYAPLSFALSWASLIMLDTFAPITASIHLERHCSLVNMDWQVYCTSASVQIGSPLRTLTIFGVQLVSIVLAYTVSRWHASMAVAPSSALGAPPLLYHSSVVAFASLDDSGRLDVVTAAMAGLLSLPRNRYFHVNLWRSVHRPSLCLPPLPVTSLATSRSSEGPLLQMFFEKARWITLGGCVVYILATLTSNVLYYSVVANDLSNDYGWAGFNSSGAQAFVANVFNRQLMLTTQEPAFALDSPGHGDMSQLYNSSTTVILWAESSARRQLYSDASLDVAVANLRRMHPCQLPWMFTQYCWLDMSQTWEMAATASRQARCARSMASNGAVYLEIGLRNLNNWTTWDTCWGDSWQLGFVKYLEMSGDGQQWLESISSAALSIEDEVRFWESHAISTFQLQWQNYKTPGMDDSIWIQSALGVTYSLQLSEFVGHYHPSQQTSFKMYWSLASDLWAITTNTSGIGGASLLRSSSLFAFVNVSTTSVLVQNTTLSLPLTSGFSLLTKAVGPFGAIDLAYVLPPKSLLVFYDGVVHNLTRLVVTDRDAQAAFVDLTLQAQYQPVPYEVVSNSNLLLGGGNIFCGNDVAPWPAANGMYVGFSVTNMCHSVFTGYLMPTRASELFSLLGANSTDADLDGICYLDTMRPSQCTTQRLKAMAFLMTYNATFASTPVLRASAAADIDALGVSMLQYLFDTATNTTLQRFYRLDDRHDRAWSFYGWGFLYEWAAGTREVLSLRGDAGRITAISSATPVLSMVPNPNAIPSSFSSLSGYCVQYITIVLILVSASLVLSVAYRRGHVECLNLLCVNRIVGMVWLGRPFVLVRSLSAIWLLNTSPLTLVQAGVATYFTSPPLAWYTTLLATSEMTWLVYVLNDLFSCVSQQYTLLYASKSSSFTWVVSFVWTLQSPQLYAATIHRRCVATDMDLQLTCVSGVIAVGSLDRLGHSMALICSCVLSTYVVQRLRFPHWPPREIPSVVLNAQSYYLMRLHAVDGALLLDKTSAIMAGLLSYEFQGRVYLMDIKSWRLWHGPTTLDAHRRASHVLPRLE
ncbi:hypothetical protein SDRG_09686 [Saprolegnia diclina VS20]|uniref:Uncharacterized protein n=1 Tax=Saprolegnia diclina (strain VS20) TaxID=1156394 RepID=T0RK86_SAPDV|nr:hypothetical protein SDRG_09686 [Saprolegnia diclina VS20]EQC32713.1 hypothetical protein SDRG_09686 [Saprolegnia diclina VS20]|eukprot:XP_008613857.1 hypothetical protein SDRG_09686 [Saprolegnia diclina VS20]